MKTSKYIWPLLLFVFVFSKCKNSKSSGDMNKSYKEIAQNWLGTDFQCKQNQNESMILCTASTQTTQLPGAGVKFLVYDLKNKVVIHRDSIDRGTVSWFGDSELALFYTPGIMASHQTRDDYTYIYNLKTKQKINKTKLD